ncbi:hypothetical protein [Luteimonas saliphila]|uniref:hypothetical protein n=1 Tax=Luteimonas saliphila TaxID=2804919 RepID=UPI00192D2B6C|nr:hypothetical protein [Luteimonas saliphila]
MQQLPLAVGERVHFSWKAPKETNQRKTLSPQRHKLEADSESGFSDSPSMARSENAAHPVRRPPGLEFTRWFEKVRESLFFVLPPVDHPCATLFPKKVGLTGSASALGDATSERETRRAARRTRAVFRHGMDAVSKNPVPASGRELVHLRESAFSLVRFFWRHQKK